MSFRKIFHLMMNTLQPPQNGFKSSTSEPFCPIPKVYNAKKGNSADQGQLTRVLAILCTFGHPAACSVLLKCCTVLLSSAEYCPVLPVLPGLLVLLLLTLHIYHCSQSYWRTFVQFNLIVNNVYSVRPLLTVGSDFIQLKVQCDLDISSQLVGVVLKRGGQ